MDNFSKWLVESPIGQLLLGLVGAVLVAVIGWLVKQNKSKQLIIGLFILTVTAMVFWLVYPQSNIPKAATLGLVVFVFVKWYRYDIAAKRRADQLEKKETDQRQEIANKYDELAAQQQKIVELEKRLDEKTNVVAQQIGRSYAVRTRGENSIDVRLLKRTGLAPNKHLDIIWETIIEGADSLARQIKQHRGGCRLNLILGINELGTILASYLNSKLWQGEKEIGIVRSGTPDMETKKRPMIYSIPDTLAKDRSQELRILLVDSEIKRGQSVKQIMDCLKEEFAVRHIYLAVLTACYVTCPVNDMVSLMYKENNRSPEQPIPVPIDFLAFFSTGGVEPPNALR